MLATWLSLTSVFRPGMALTCLGLASTTSKSLSSREAKMGIQYIPVDSITIFVQLFVFSHCFSSKSSSRCTLNLCVSLLWLSDRIVATISSFAISSLHTGFMFVVSSFLWLGLVLAFSFRLIFSFGLKAPFF